MASSSMDYRYTVDDCTLSVQERRDYEDKGYLLIKNCVAADKLDKYRRRFLQICNSEVQIPGLTVFKDLIRVQNADRTDYDNERAVIKLQDLHTDEQLFEYCQLPEILSFVRCFTGPNVMAMHSMFINKPPDNGKLTSRHPMHQDLYYFPFRPTDRIVGAWTAMERIDRTNGCLFVVPGSHERPLQKHVYPPWEGGVNKMYHGISGYQPEENTLYVEMDEGDTIFFHPLLYHGSGLNNSSRFRKAISCHYGASECHYIDVKGSYQEVIANEVMAVVAKRLGKKIADQMVYADVWRNKAILVHGVRQDSQHL